MVAAPDGRRTDRVVIVTDGSHGVGREVTDRLARLGYAVAFSYADDQREAESTVEAVLAGDGTAIAVRADITDEMDVERLFTETIALFGVVDAVVHARCGLRSLGRLSELGLAEFDAMCTATVRAALVVNQQAVRHLRAGGTIVNLFDWVTSSGFTRYGPNATAAAAVQVLTRALSMELLDRGIAVDAVAIDIDQHLPAAWVADAIAYLLDAQLHTETGRVMHRDDWLEVSALFCRPGDDRA